MVALQMPIHTKTKKSAQLLFCFLLAIFCISCASTARHEKPLWADSFTISQVFPSERYISSLGYAATKEMAISASDGNLASYFSREISSFIRATQNLSNTDETKESLSREIIIKSNIELFGIKHTEPYFDSDNKSYIVCAYISREEAWSILEPKLNIQYSSISKSINQVRNQNGLKAIININKLMSAASNFEELYYMALFIFPNRCEKYTNMMEELAELKQMSQILKHEVRIKINIKGDSDERIYTKISSLVTDAGFTICKSGENHIMSVDVDIAEQITGKVQSIYPQISVVISDRKGIVSSFSKSLEKVSAFNSATVKKMALSKIENVLEEEFAETCLK